MTPKARNTVRRAGAQNRNGKGRFDAELIAAKGRQVALVLALPTTDTENDGSITCYIREVDTYSIKVTKNLKTGKDFWISKGFIVSATIL